MVGNLWVQGYLSPLWHHKKPISTAVYFTIHTLRSAAQQKKQSTLDFQQKSMCSVVKVLSSRLAAVDVATSWWRGSSRQPSAQTAPPHGCRCRRTACPSVAAAPWRSAGSLCACSCRPRSEGTITLSHHHAVTFHTFLLFSLPNYFQPSLSPPPPLACLRPVVEGDSGGRLLLAEEGGWLHLGVAEAQVLVQVVEPVDEVAHMAAEHLEFENLKLQTFRGENSCDSYF